jgi:lysophospholipase L1-like esterase
MRVLVFGDSITQGYWAVSHGWVDRVRRHYDGIQITGLNELDEPTVFNLGVSADNSDNILLRIEAEVRARTRPTHSTKPIIVVQVGINDGSTQPDESQVSLEKYEQNLRQIAATMKPLSSRLIFVGFSSCNEEQTTPVDWGDFYYRNETIKTYEASMAKVASEQSVDFIPVFDEFEKVAAKNKDLLPDGLHPNESGHELMYNIIMPKLQELLV